MIAKGTTGIAHAFLAFDASGNVWSGAAFVPWVQANSTSYKVTATELGTSGAFNGTLPANTAKWLLCQLTTGQFGDPITDPLNIKDEGDISSGGGGGNIDTTLESDPDSPGNYRFTETSLANAPTTTVVNRPTTIINRTVTITD